MKTHLSNATLEKLPVTVVTPDYDRTKVSAGVAHIGVGNFHRAHQALYLDRILALPGQEAWGILGVGIRQGKRETERADAFAKQDGLFTLTEFSPDDPAVVRVVGSIVDYVSCNEGYDALIRRLADPAIRIVTLTITEGGYFVDADGAFMVDDPFIAEDLKRDIPQSAFGLVCEALRLRRDEGVGPFTVLSCDNLQHNGTAAQSAFCGFAEARDPSLGAWIRENVSFPSSMVDRIAPSVTDADVARLNDASGVEDLTPVYSEDFRQWVVEDAFCAGRPEFEAVGVQLRADVAPYEQVKLRMLNAAHTVVSHVGLRIGYRTVHAAMQDLRVVSLLESFLDGDVAPLLTPPDDVDVGEYARNVLRRFRSAAVGDQLERIASDSFAKLPVFLGTTVRELIDAGRDISLEAFTLACWAENAANVDDKGAPFELREPNASDADLARLRADDLAAPLSLTLFDGWGVAGSESFASRFVAFRKDIRERGAAKVLADMQA